MKFKVGDIVSHKEYDGNLIVAATWEDWSRHPYSLLALKITDKILLSKEDKLTFVSEGGIGLLEFIKTQRKALIPEFDVGRSQEHPMYYSIYDDPYK